MSTSFRSSMRDLMKQAWLLVKRYGFTMGDAMRQAWLVLKLKKAMKSRIVKFLFQKVNGEMRTAWGTLQDNVLPPTSGNDRKKNESIFTYFDTDKSEYRCFKVANLIRVEL